jgi:pre-mRNA-splicing factor SYF2
MAEPVAKKRRLSPPVENTYKGTEAADDVVETSEPPSVPDNSPDLATEARHADTPPASKQSPAPTDRAARFAALKARATDSARSNLAEAKAEAQRSVVDPTVLASLSRRSAIAQHKLLKADTEADGGDGAFERKRAWDYTIEESEKWDERMARKKDARDNNVFQDYSREAGKIYDRQIRELEKNGGKDRQDYLEQKAKLIEEAARNGGLEIIETEDGELVAIDKDGKFYADSDNTSFIESKPKKENVDRLVEELRKAEEIRLKKRKARGHDQDEGDVTFINEKNKQFNMKLARFYDRYTKDIRESFERGTAI